MKRWSLLACCFVLGACKTVTTPTRTDVLSIGADLHPDASVHPGRPAGTNPEQVNGIFPVPAVREDARPIMLPKPSVSVNEAVAEALLTQAGITEDRPPEPHPHVHITEPIPPVETVVLPALPLPMHRGEKPPGRSLPLPLSSPAQPGEVTVGGSLSLPLSSPARHNDTDFATPLPLYSRDAPPHTEAGSSAEAVTIPPWLSDVQTANAWRESEMARQARTQKEREEQFQQFRRVFYHFLAVTNTGE